MIAFPYLEGATLADVKQVFMQEGEPAGPPPLDFEGIAGSAVLEGARSRWFSSI